ncbi:MAG: HNH endonuclease [Bdellovibrionaceae bacterium]|nr:HNH endonuclease [Pseudobdellovibrionaceae bacterium]
MRRLATASMLLVLVSFQTVFAADYPQGPEPQLTPGMLCAQPNSRRYPEKIAYCERNVAVSTKEEIIAQYDKQFGYKIERLPRGDFKIDHYIPLCMGGDNDISNLWPQHMSVYEITDPLEALLCEKMSEGRLSQKDAITLMKQAKSNLDSTPAITRKVQAL